MINDTELQFAKQQLKKFFNTYRRELSEHVETSGYEITDEMVRALHYIRTVHGVETTPDNLKAFLTDWPMQKVMQKISQNKNNTVIYNCSDTPSVRGYYRGRYVREFLETEVSA
jgi:hypothetical protein